MCHRVQLTPVPLTSAIFGHVLSRLRESHSNGGVFLTVFHVSANDTFDWFASRNRLLENGILASILSRLEVRQALPDLMIPADSENSATAPSCPTGDVNGFKMEAPFLIDGHLVHSLYSGGAYWKQSGDGRAEKQMALDFCEGAFGLRFSEMLYYISHEAWTDWFHGIAWDSTAVLFDRRLRNLWILVVTDTD
jgi:hypothetical protein